MRCSSTPTRPRVDLRGEMRAHAREQLHWWPVDATAESIADALLPLPHPTRSALSRGSPCRDLRPGDRLASWTSSSRSRAVTTAVAPPRSGSRDVAPLWRAAPDGDDPLAPYADRLEQPALGGQELRGYLSGSDRRGPPASPARWEPRFVVVDYKTNLLGEPGRPATAADYGPGPSRRRHAGTRTTRCRRCSTPSCCTATCAGGCPATPPSATSVACSTSTCAACAGPRHAGRRRAPGRSVQLVAAGGADRRRLRPARRTPWRPSTRG